MKKFDDSWHRKFTLKVRFLTNCVIHCIQKKIDILWECWFWPKILLFRTRPLWNSTTEMTLLIKPWRFIRNFSIFNVWGSERLGTFEYLKCKEIWTQLHKHFDHILQWRFAQKYMHNKFSQKKIVTYYLQKVLSIYKKWKVCQKLQSKYCKRLR